MVKHKNKSRNIIGLILAGGIFLAGCTLLFYPTVSQWANNRFQSTVCAEYAEAVEELNDLDAQKELDRAEDYNKNLAQSVELLDNPFIESEAVQNSGYDTLLNATAEGVMAYLEIPEINVLLPIYHGVGSAELSKGIGHLPETSLPVGGKSTHCVLAGHSGINQIPIHSFRKEVK